MAVDEYRSIISHFQLKLTLAWNKLTKGIALYEVTDRPQSE